MSSRKLSFSVLFPSLRALVRGAGLAIVFVALASEASRVDAQVVGTITPSGSFLPFERSFFTSVLTNQGPGDEGSPFFPEYGHSLFDMVRVDRVDATIGSVVATPSGPESTSVTWNGVLCGTQSSCPRTVTIVAEVFPEYAAQDQNVLTIGSVFGSNGFVTSFTNTAAARVRVLPPFPTAPMLAGSGAVTLAKFCGVNAFERVGGVLASGDFDGDGFDDLAIGVPRRSVGSIVGAGAVCILHGGADPFSANSVRPQFLHHGLSGIFGSIQTSGAFGESLATGDFNGDGFADLAVGASFYDVGRAVDSGAVWVFSGSAQGLQTVGSRFIDQAGFPNEADQGQDRFGFALAAGDVDADGLDDLIVGVPFEDVGNYANTVADAGVVQILHSAATGNPLSKRQTVVAAGPRFLDGVLLRDETAEANDRFGWRVAAGDLAGTAAEEWVASSPFETVGSVAAIAAGVVEVYGIDSSGVVSVVHSDSPCDRGACSNGQRFGDALEVADVNGDSRADLVVTDRATVGGAALAGSVTVFGAVPPRFGRYLDPFVLHQSAPVPTPGTPGASDLFGFALATGDFNGDGMNDLAAGVPAENTGATNNTGFVNVFYSPWGNFTSQGLQGFDQAALAEALEAGDEFGTALASGDFDGDGFDDLAIGVPGEELASGPTDHGVVQVIFGGGGR